MKKQLKKAFPYVMLLTAWAVIFAAVLLGERIPKELSLALFTVGGVLLGFGAGHRPEPHPPVPGAAEGV